MVETARETPIGASTLGTAIRLKQLSIPNYNVLGAQTIAILKKMGQLEDLSI